jgi:asparagine synthase (glutamine-hydrolysing)
MSVQFGTWNCDGRAVEPSYLERAGKLLAPFGPDAQCAYIKDSVGILFHPFHTTKESRRETQPLITPSGAVLTWDGRIDNRAELLGQLKDGLADDSTDVAIVAAACEEWGTRCFAKLIGDWALSVWNPISRSLILAKDPVGTRNLYYSFGKGQVVWSSILDPLVLCAEKTFELEEEYIAGWLSFFPATHLTPYKGIHAVPPSCIVRLVPGKRTVTKYWDFDPGNRVRYRTDGEYEEHFRHVFSESVRRRLRSDSPVLAELSGGMDSASIVCMADTIIDRMATETRRLDTVSYYLESEFNWDERAFFTKVEEKRGRTGYHIDAGLDDRFSVRALQNSFAAVPVSDGRSQRASQQFTDQINLQGYRVVLSGIGGDEVTGGVPTPIPELADLLARGQLKRLAHQLKLWALAKRIPWFYLLSDTFRVFISPILVGVPSYKRPAAWLNRDFTRRNRTPLRGYETRLKALGPMPSFQENMSTLNALCGQLGAFALPSTPSYEKRYPFLDRDLLEFLFGVPREQLVRPSERRSLQRRSLAGIVPDEVLNRKRKAFVSRAPVAGMFAEWERLSGMSEEPVSSDMGIVDLKRVSDALRAARQGHELPVVTLMRTVGLEAWLRDLIGRQVLRRPAHAENWSHSSRALLDP